MGSPQDSSSSDPPVLDDENDPKIKTGVLHDDYDASKIPDEVDFDDHGKDDSARKKMGKDDDEQQKENQEDSSSESSPVLGANNASEFHERFGLSDSDDVSEDEEEGSKIVVYDSDEWEWDEYDYGPNILPGYQRISLPLGIENAFLRPYNHDLSCYDDDYDSDRQLQKALFESILVLESSNFNPSAQVRESFSFEKGICKET